MARVIFGPDGVLYGTTTSGGYTGGNCALYGGCGTVFKLRPLPTACKTALCKWTKTDLYQFGEPPDGDGPTGDLIFDQARNIYGTTVNGGVVNGNCVDGCGTVYELTRPGSNWTESVLYSFSGSDGQNPFSGLLLDGAGNLYGTTFLGGTGGDGTVFQLTNSGLGWTENILHNFQGSDGYLTYAGLILDHLGNLYGTSSTSTGGSGSGGTVFELTPSNGSWTFSVLYTFTGPSGYLECGPNDNLVMDGAGNIYGTTRCDGAYNAGSVFKLTPTPTPPWTYTSLHDFTGGSDGGNPYSNVIFDANGNLYGTASAGGAYGYGVVWEITP